MEPQTFPTLRLLQEQMLWNVERIKRKIVERDSECTELKIELYETIIREQRALIRHASKTARKLCQEKKLAIKKSKKQKKLS